jgi:hypothetical protein
VRPDGTVTAVVKVDGKVAWEQSSDNP